MTQKEKKESSWWLFGAISGCSLIVAGLFFYNIVLWSNLPDSGFFFRSATGIDIVGGVRNRGVSAGLRVGDRIVEVNGKGFSTIEERRDAVIDEIGKKNVFLIERDGTRIEVTIQNERLGFKPSFVQCGFTFLTGLIYVLIGILVFLMKPHRSSSWAFFANSACLGLVLLFLVKGGKSNPSFLGTIHLFAWAFAPATIVHLTLSFPEKRQWVARYPITLYFSYVLSVAIFIGTRSISAEMVSIPRKWYLITLFYLIASLIGFLASCIQLWIRSPSEIVRMRSKCVLIGAFVASFIPIMDLVSSSVFHAFSVPGFNYYLPFLIFFPVCVAYSIVKHNLFDIQTAVRRTFGYILMTASIALLYTVLVFIPTMVFGKKGFAEYPGIAIGGILLIIFIINLFRQPIQQMVDRVFYRMEYDYRETVIRISAALRTAVSTDQILKAMRDLSDKTLAVENCCLLLQDRDDADFACVFPKGSELCLPSEDPIIDKILGRKRELTVYDLEEDPAFAHEAQKFKNTFHQLDVEIIVPIIFEDRLLGLMVLGKKKSGRFFKREDIMLLNTFANQAGTALENIRLQKARLEALELSRKELEQLSRAKSKALDLLSHELKTPLSVITGTLKTLERTDDATGDLHKREKMYRRVEAHLKRLYEIQDATDTIIRSHAEAERHLSEPWKEEAVPDIAARFNLYAVSRQALVSARERAHPRDLFFELEGLETLEVQAAPAIIETALEGMIRNAVENTPDEGLIQIRFIEEDGRVSLSVQDYGVGVTDENQKYLFEALYPTQESDRYRTAKPYEFNAGGKGLSLFRIKSQADRFGFDFSMKSKRCVFLPTDEDICPGRISLCPHCKERGDCLASGGTTFTLAFSGAE